MQRNIPSQAAMVTERLQRIQSQPCTVVFRGQKDVTSDQTQTVGSFQRIDLAYQAQVTDYLLERIAQVQQEHKKNRVYLVTADKKLRQAALAIKPTLKHVVNPRVFWRRQFPRLSGIRRERNALHNAAQRERRQALRVETQVARTLENQKKRKKKVVPKRRRKTPTKKK
eukprot:Nitzschia sp. Nitz4//scaffold133_size116822//68936//69442//NITZ4_003810-RA/size116822-processed-gene-0.62-mRNA-1//-1//CDS//3329535405//769//frame0